MRQSRSPALALKRSLLSFGSEMLDLLGRHVTACPAARIGGQPPNLGDNCHLS
jgi:hypothetical protein